MNFSCFNVGPDTLYSSRWNCIRPSWAKSSFEVKEIFQFIFFTSGIADSSSWPFWTRMGPHHSSVRSIASDAVTGLHHVGHGRLITDHGSHCTGGLLCWLQVITISAKVANNAMRVLGGALRHLTNTNCPSPPLHCALRHAAHQAVELRCYALHWIVATFVHVQIQGCRVPVAKVLCSCNQEGHLVPAEWLVSQHQLEDRVHLTQDRNAITRNFTLFQHSICSSNHLVVNSARGEP